MERTRSAFWPLATIFRTRAALGLDPVAAPVVLFIPLGILLGAGGLEILTENALARLDPIISIALATLGVVIGIAAAADGRRSPRLFLAASVEASVTIGVVAGAILLLLSAWGLAVGIPDALVALALGISASASAAPVVTVTSDRSGHTAARVADLDDVLPIVLTGLVVVLATPGGAHPLAHGAVTVALGLALGAAGWILLEHAESSAERGVFVLGSLALLGGCAAYLGLSPLLTGMAAGALWTLAPGGAEQVVKKELRKVHNPLVVLLLLTAGAGLEVSTAGIWLFAPYVVFRFAGKLMGGWAASRIAPAVAPSDLGAYLIPPGVIGIAFALNLQQITPVADVLVFAVAVGAVACELLALLVTPAPRPD